MGKMGKKKWTKPEITKVKLISEEAILTGCKLSGGTATAIGSGTCAAKTCKGLTS